MSLNPNIGIKDYEAIRSKALLENDNRFCLKTWRAGVLTRHDCRQARRQRTATLHTATIVFRRNQIFLIFYIFVDLALCLRASVVNYSA